MTQEVSVVDYLTKSGKDSSLSARATLATNNGLVKNTQEYIDLAGKGQNADINTRLLGILQKGGTTTTTPTTPTSVNNLNDASSFINANQDADITNASKTTNDEPPIRTSVQSYTDLFKQLQGGVAPAGSRPEVPNFTQQFTDLRAQQGISGLEKTLSDKKTAAQAIKDRNAARKVNEQGKTVATNVIAGRMSEVDKQDQIELDNINREIEQASSELKTKYDVVNNLMELGKLDFDTATSTYDKKFSQNLDLFNTVKGIAEDEKSEKEKLEDNARANLQIIYNNLTSGGSNIDSLSQDQINNISKLEMQSGLPVGFYKSLQAKNPKQDILSTTTRVSNGKKYADVISRNSDGSLSTKSILIGGTSTGSGSSSAGTVKSGSALFSKSQLSQLEGRLDQSRGQDGYVDPDVYKQAFEAWTDPSVGGLSKDFLAKYPPKNYVNPANDQLPNYLRSGNKASTTSTKGRSI